MAKTYRSPVLDLLLMERALVECQVKELEVLLAERERTVGDDVVYATMMVKRALLGDALAGLKERIVEAIEILNAPESAASNVVHLRR